MIVRFAGKYILKHLYIINVSFPPEIIFKLLIIEDRQKNVTQISEFQHSEVIMEVKQSPD